MDASAGSLLSRAPNEDAGPLPLREPPPLALPVAPPLALSSPLAVGNAAASSSAAFAASLGSAALLVRSGMAEPGALPVLHPPFPVMQLARSMEQPQPQVLRPSRLVEVMHAALSASRLAPQEGRKQQETEEQAAGAAPEADRAGQLKRELAGAAGGSPAGAPDLKRVRSESGGGSAAQHTAAVPAAQAEGAPPATAVEDTAPPFARPPAASLNGSDAGAGAGAHVPGAPAADGGSAAAPMRSAFAQPGTVSVGTDWLLGCSITRGRRSARSPAPAGSRSHSILRAASADVASSPMSRRGSGFVTHASAFAAEAVNGFHGNGGASGEAAATTEAVGAGPWGGGAAPESTRSADIRRLAQLAEAAAMLEQQLGGVGSRARGSAPGSNGRTQGTAKDGPDALAAAQRNGASGAEPEPQQQLRLRSAGSLAAMSGIAAAAAGGMGRQPSIPLPFMASAPLPLQPLPSTLPLSRAVESLSAQGGLARAHSAAAREGSPDSTDMTGLRQGSEAPSGGSHEHMLNGNGDGDNTGDGSNDSGGDGSSGGDGKSLTERYRAALKASALQQRWRPSGKGSQASGSPRADPDPSRAVRNGVCARIASITKERLQQVYHLNIEEAARELGIGMTKLKEHCRTLGIPRWPSRKLKSMDKLIESLNERAMTEPATKEVIADILAEIESFKRAIYENPCLEVEEDIKRLRQSNFKKEYQQRQVEQRMRLGSVDRLPSSGPSGRVRDGTPRENTGARSPTASGLSGPSNSLPPGGLPSTLSAAPLPLPLPLPAPGSVPLPATVGSSQLHPSMWQQLSQRSTGNVPAQNVVLPPALAGPPPAAMAPAVAAAEGDAARA